MWKCSTVKTALGFTHLTKAIKKTKGYQRTGEDTEPSKQNDQRIGATSLKGKIKLLGSREEKVF